MPDGSPELQGKMHDPQQQPSSSATKQVQPPSLCLACRDARVMWDPYTRRSKGFGFVTFTKLEDAGRAIAELNGHLLGSRRLRCDWAQHKLAEHVAHAGSLLCTHGVVCTPYPCGDHYVSLLRRKKMMLLGDKSPSLPGTFPHHGIGRHSRHQLVYLCLCRIPWSKEWMRHQWTGAGQEEEVVHIPVVAYILPLRAVVP
eukprot:scaffold233168_cov18-Tisochrysis_lutea.AAC.1